jgi:hypothetical protein
MAHAGIANIIIAERLQMRSRPADSRIRRNND